MSILVLVGLWYVVCIMHYRHKDFCRMCKCGKSTTHSPEVDTISLLPRTLPFGCYALVWFIYNTKHDKINICMKFSAEYDVFF